VVAIGGLGYCNVSVGWLLERGPLLPHLWMVAIYSIGYCHIS
jgi:hypothetical protein